VGARLLHAPVHPVTRTFLFWFDLDRGREELIRAYLRQLLALQQGHRSEEPLPAPAPGLMADSIEFLRPYLERSLSAWRATRSNDVPGALAALESNWDGMETVQSEVSAAYARPWDHFLKAMLLENLGQREQALRWFSAAGDESIATLPYLAPAALHRGRLLEQMERRSEAAGAYRQVIRLWSGADPEFQPLVEEAREGVRRMAKEEERREK
jgi:tetratricopeptide (TPR) repeat protein